MASDARFCLDCGAQMNGGQQSAGKSFCGSCGHPKTTDALFCEKCGLPFQGAQQAAPVAEPPQIEANLRKFRARLTASCSHCGYHGLMGWNDFHFPVAKAVWMPVALLLCLVGVIPGLIVFLLIQRKKRYAAECPNCGKALLLKMDEAEVAKTPGEALSFIIRAVKRYFPRSCWLKRDNGSSSGPSASLH
jgi:hypothetical protein